MTDSETMELGVLLRRAMRRTDHIKTACYGKQNFEGPQEASRAIRHAGMNSYRCEFCGFWHVGHSLGPQTRRS
jgi:hypothetical protein